LGILGSQLPPSGEIHFLPLRQVLDGRVQRRLRRNGLSEEMNTIYQEKRRRAHETKAELDRLRTELKARDEEIHRLENETIIVDTERIWELEREIEQLRRELSDRSGIQDRTRSYDWTLAAKDPFADGYMDTDQDAFGDATVAELECSTPTRRRGQSSFLTPPLTSPAMPLTPSSHIAATPHANVGVQASFPDPEKQQLEDEMASLQLEVCKLNTTLESYTALANRLTERLSTLTLPESMEVDTDRAGSHQSIEDQLNYLMQSLSDRTAALVDLTSSLSALGFPGGDASEIITSLRAGFRAARLELEYLTPGEISLPLSSHGAEVLDLVLGRLREMSKKAKEDEDSIDEYHDIELSLRQQLNSRVAAMEDLNAELAKAQTLLDEKTMELTDQEVSVDRLKGAVNGYIRDMSELEALVQRMEAEGRETEGQLQSQLQANKVVIEGKETSIAELETKLSEAVSQTEALRKQVTDIQKNKATEIANLNKQHGSSLALRDARVSELRLEIDRVNESLRTAHETIRSLRVEKTGLETKMQDDKAKAKAVIDSMKEELQHVVRMSQDFLTTPKKQSNTRRGSDASSSRVTVDARGSAEPERIPSSPLASGVVVKRGGLLSGDLARRASGKRRRRYDSGLGFLDEDEVDI
jgi:hypothetical protein